MSNPNDRDRILSNARMRMPMTLNGAFELEELLNQYPEPLRLDGSRSHRYVRASTGKEVIIGVNS